MLLERGAPVIVDVCLLSADGETSRPQRYRFFAADEFPLRSLLARIRENPARLFQLNHE